jgi:NAD(P)-dependent dehydrogenase (short-subunit alcohol dehydrogenase family)
MRLKDKVAIITGGGRGIGKAIALGFASEGAAVIVAARNQNEIASTVEEIRKLGVDCIDVVCDITKEDMVKNLMDAALNHFGKINILVNNAGVGGARPVYAIPLDSFLNIIQVNLVGTFLCTKYVWQPMKSSGGGSIINISSLGGLVGYPLLSAYCASKWGQIGFTKSCAEEGKKVNIRVNSIAPGKADTMIRSLVKEDKSKMLRAEDHISACVFLASDDSKFITGQVLPIEWFG